MVAFYQPKPQNDRIFPGIALNHRRCWRWLSDDTLQFSRLAYCISIPLLMRSANHSCAAIELTNTLETPRRIVQWVGRTDSLVVVGRSWPSRHTTRLRLAIRRDDVSGNGIRSWNRTRAHIAVHAETSIARSIHTQHLSHQAPRCRIHYTQTSSVGSHQPRW